MTTTFLVASSLVKVLVILLITVGGFAPILIWAERRQSAMIQDRLGPSRAAIASVERSIVVPEAFRRYRVKSISPMRMKPAVPAPTCMAPMR